MHRPLLLRGARQLLTLRGAEGVRRGSQCLDLGIINDGSVLIRNGRIVTVGQSRRVDNLSEARHAIVYDAHGCVVMPGFLDANLAVSANSLASRRLLQLAFAHGSTAIGICGTYFPLRSLAAADPVSPALIATLDVDHAIDEGQLQRAVRRNLAAFLRFDILTHSRSTLRLLHGLGPALRVRCLAPERQDWLGLALAYGAFTIDIDSVLNRAQAALLADSPACAILAPDAFHSARALLDADAAIAAGSGFDSLPGGTCSMQTVLLDLVRTGGLDMAEAISLATINAAHSLGASARYGSIEPGKSADLLVLHVSDYRDMVNFQGVNIVSKIVQAGNLVA
ncbi:MAG TPA: amidohydrolase family protein [Bryobacteraceae bacterium]|nr:amidohydrolase family protein [Bryobacteraceae bacterium]